MTPSESPWLSARAHVSTDRAQRYLTQLCEHVGHLGGGHRHRARAHAGASAHVQQAECDASHGVLTFDAGSCTLDATEDELVVRVLAADAAGLQSIKDALVRRLETIGRRDHLVVRWSPDHQA